MKTYSYSAVGKHGEKITDGIDAENETTAVLSLKERGLYVKEIKETRLVTKAETHLVPPKKVKVQKKKPGLFARRKVDDKTLMLFTRNLATLLEAGIPLTSALVMLSEQEPHPLMKDTLIVLNQLIHEGSSLSEAMTRRPKIFNNLYINMILAGEMGGSLEVSLERVAGFMENAQKVKGKVKGAMVYPLFIMFIAIVIVTGLMLFIVPKFQKIFKSMLNGRPLPILTQMIIDFSDFIRHYGIFLLIGIVLMVPLCKAILKYKKAARAWDKALFWMPVFGTLVSKSEISRFVKTLGTLIASGVPILEAMKISRVTANNSVLGDAILSIHDNVKQGDTIREPMLASGCFPRMVVGMIHAGEETGQLPKMLLKVADYYEQEVDDAVASLTSLMEPIMIVFLAMIIGAVVIALFLPLVGIISGLTDSSQ